jgi:hypothetical protein
VGCGGLSITFFDRFGNVVFRWVGGGIRFDKNIAQWQPVGRRYLVPVGTQFAKWSCHKGKKGTFASLICTCSTGEAAGAPLAAWARVNVSKPLDAKPNEGIHPRPNALGQIDEKAIKVTLRFCEGQAGGDGSKPGLQLASGGS